MLLIAYDGSQDAQAAIQHAGQLMPGTAVTVLTIWEPFTTMLARTPETLRPLARRPALPRSQRRRGCSSHARPDSTPRH